MKKMFMDQKGYALIIVLLIIVIIGIMVPVLVGSVLNSAKQNKITEEQIQLNQIANMGLIYFQNQFNMNKSAIISDIQSKLDNSSGELTSDGISNIIKNIEALTKVPRNVQIDGTKEDFLYTVEIKGNKVDSGGFEIYYTSTAKKLSDGKSKEKEDHLTFNISNLDTSNVNK